MEDTEPTPINAPPTEAEEALLDDALAPILNDVAAANCSDGGGSSPAKRRRASPRETMADSSSAHGQPVEGTEIANVFNNDDDDDAYDEKPQAVFPNNKNDDDTKQNRKATRINWSKSPHRERLTTILNDWFTQSGQAIDCITNEPISDYREFAKKVGISPTTLYKYVQKDVGKRRMVDTDGKRGKKRLIDGEGVKFVVEEIKRRTVAATATAGGTTNVGFSRQEAINIIADRFSIEKRPASRQLTRYILPVLNSNGLAMVNDNGIDRGLRVSADGVGKVGAPTVSTQRVQRNSIDERQNKLERQQREQGEQQQKHQQLEEEVTQKKRSIVISGVTSGIGRALLEYYYNHGHIIAGCGRRQGEIQSLQQQFPNAKLSVVDVSCDESVKHWATSLSCGSDGMKVDLIIANAGISPETSHNNKPSWEVPLADFDSTIDINVKGVSNMIRNFVPQLIHNNIGAFVAMSSGLGRSPNPYHAAYCASKWAVEGMVKSVAMSLPAPLCAVPLAPGVIETSMQPADDSNVGKGSTKKTKVGNVSDWIKVAGPMILNMNRKDNGKSLSVKSFYTLKYRQSWIIQDGVGVPKKLGHSF